MYCEVLVKILKSCDAKLIPAAYAQMKVCLGEVHKRFTVLPWFWECLERSICNNEKLFLANFEQRL